MEFVVYPKRQIIVRLVCGVINKENLVFEEKFLETNQLRPIDGSYPGTVRFGVE
ncbi:MAG: hypothetical protein ACK5Z0_03360 [Planctomycetota bacterium]